MAFRCVPNAVSPVVEITVARASYAGNDVQFMNAQNMPDGSDFGFRAGSSSGEIFPCQKFEGPRRCMTGLGVGRPSIREKALTP